MKTLIIFLAALLVIGSSVCPGQPAEQLSARQEETAISRAGFSSPEPKLPAAESLQRQNTIPVLMYHHLTDNPVLDGDLCPGVFEEQLEFLAREGYQTITPDYLYRFIRGEKQPEQPKVLITFDDGYESFYNKAVPLLEKYDFEATLFIYTDRIKDREGYLSASDLQELARRGISVQSHGVTHTPLTEISENHPPEDSEQKIKAELGKSKELLENITGSPVNHFAFPYGSFNSEIILSAREAGYDLLFIADERETQAPFIVPRIPIQRDMDKENFRDIFR